MEHDEHTPGPWTVYPWQGGEICVDTVDENGDADECVATLQPRSNAEANARLIAAAPDLLAALEGLFREHTLIHKHWGDGNNARAAAAAEQAAREAIATARGEAVRA